MTRKITILPVIAALCAMLLIGCTPGTDTDAQSSAQPTQAPGEPLQSAPVDCDWTMQIDQTIPVTQDGMTVNYTLVLTAQKMGGTDIYGTYQGMAYLGCELDASNLSNEVITVTGGFNLQAYSQSFSFDVIPYDAEAYSDYALAEGEPPLAQLVDHESMALTTPDMTASGSLNPSIDGIQGENGGVDESVSGTSPVPMKITINSGKVRVSVPSLKLSDSFEGMLLGTPVGSGDDSGYEQTRDKIDDLIAEISASPNNDNDASDNGEQSALGGIMGNVGDHMQLPDDFPKDIPLLEDANIFNTNDANGAVRIMYGTQSSQEDVLSFYQESLLDEMGADAIPVDGGVMYMGSTDKYRNILFMVTEDASGTYGRVVYIEVSLS